MMGRDKKNERRGEHFAAMTRRMMETPAWRALSPTAQALYPWLKLEWRGPQHNNNGKLRLSARQAAQRLGVGVDTAARAFRDLQAKGFVAVTEGARLGVGGDATSPKYELTELSIINGVNNREGRKLYLEWREGADFPVVKAVPHNPKGANGKTDPCHDFRDGAVIKIGTRRKGAS